SARGRRAPNRVGARRGYPTVPSRTVGQVPAPSLFQCSSQPASPRRPPSTASLLYQLDRKLLMPAAQRRASGAAVSACASAPALIVPRPADFIVQHDRRAPASARRVFPAGDGPPRAG